MGSGTNTLWYVSIMIIVMILFEVLSIAIFHRSILAAKLDIGFVFRQALDSLLIMSFNNWMIRETFCQIELKYGWLDSLNRLTCSCYSGSFYRQRVNWRGTFVCTKYILILIWNPTLVVFHIQFFTTKILSIYLAGQTSIRLGS